MNPLEGQVKVIYVTADSSGAGITEVPLCPSDNELWYLLWALGQQNDGDVICAWKWNDVKNPGGIQLFAENVSANRPFAFGGFVESQQGPGSAPVEITHQRYPSYIFDASAVGKTAVIVALVVEQIGVEGAI